jgi:hypothetical protein
VSGATLELGRRIPLIARLSAAASPSLIRWTLRIVTTILFAAATAFGVSLGMSAPEIPATSVDDHHVAASNR